MSTTRQELFNIVLESAKTQAFNVYSPDEEMYIEKEVGDTLYSFLENTSIGQYADDIFEHTTNRILEALKDQLKTDPEPIGLEFNAIARVLGEVLPTEYNWQHIRQTSKAFVEKLTQLHMERTIKS